MKQSTSDKLRTLLQLIFQQQASQAALLVKPDAPLPDMEWMVPATAEAVKPLVAELYRQGMVQAAARMAVKLGRGPVRMPRAQEPRRVEVGNDAVFGAAVGQASGRTPNTVIGDAPAAPNAALFKTMGDKYTISRLDRELDDDRWEPGQRKIAWLVLVNGVVTDRLDTRRDAEELIREYRRQDTKAWDAPSKLAALPGLLVPSLFKTARGRIVCKAAPDIGFDFDLFNPRVLRAVDALTMAFCTDTFLTASLAIRDAQEATRQLLRDGLPKGAAVELLARQVRMIFADPKRAFTIAATEGSRAVHGGQMAAAQEAGVERHSWLVSADACEHCLKLDGKTVKIGEPFWVNPKGGPYAVVLHPPLHPHCFCSVTEEI